MKLKLSFEQAAEVIRSNFNLPADAEIVIQRSNKGPFAPLRQMITDINGMRYQTDEKIPAIKRYREVVPNTGLAEAKWAIENWDKVRSWILKNRRAPICSGIYPYYELR